MATLSRHRVLIAGTLSPLAAMLLYAIVYIILSRLSSNLEKDWLFRLSASTLAMAVPFLVTVALALQDHRRQRSLSLTAWFGLVLAFFSLALAWKPVKDGITRSRQERNMAMQNVAAPVFSTLDLDGNPQRLTDQKGKVVLVNIWATWCGPCRAEMPRLDQMYRQRKAQGLTVFGLSDEDPDTQRRYLQQVPVTYPLLTFKGEVPSLYRDIARYPAIFLIDREGRLRPAPGPEKSFDTLEAAVDALLRNGPA
jgi:peroxiredoxin